jgi:hypothetical protein
MLLAVLLLVFTNTSLPQRVSPALTTPGLRLRERAGIRLGTGRVAKSEELVARSQDRRGVPEPRWSAAQMAWRSSARGTPYPSRSVRPST